MMKHSFPSKWIMAIVIQMMWKNRNNFRVNKQKYLQSRPYSKTLPCQIQKLQTCRTQSYSIVLSVPLRLPSQSLETCPTTLLCKGQALIWTIKLDQRKSTSQISLPS
ncbi:hypothetical protein FGO68_gene8565 [Halteria grandinella]|uniref:Uncharacterized protein n=1 Tax=Halteria grandinella TaxID=5974 RepID=A0A8J8SUA7_HALGN|nr:hypothetical protein FGO68_gene8565 [Halteria grandinella]